MIVRMRVHTIVYMIVYGVMLQHAIEYYGAL